MTANVLNASALNDTPINGGPPTYLSGVASLSHGHSLQADGQAYVEPFGAINHLGLNTAQVNAGSGLYANAKAALGHSHTLSGTLSFGSDTYKFGSATLTHNHSLVGDLTFGSSIYVYGSTTLGHSHTLSGTLQLIATGSSTMAHSHTLAGTATIYTSVNGAASLQHTHLLPGSLSLVPFVDASSVMTHNHYLQWNDSLSVYGRATLPHGHTLSGTGLGGTPLVDDDLVWVAAEPVPDIEPASADTRNTTLFSMSYNVEGFRYRFSGVNFCPVNTYPVDQNCGATPEPDLSWELDQSYGVGETSLSLGSQWSYMYDVSQVEWELNQKYGLDVITTTLVQWEQDSSYVTYGKTVLQELLDLINAERASLALTPYTLYDGAGEDVATTHSIDMAQTGVFAHEDGAFPVGYRTPKERLTHIAESPTNYGENIAYVSHPSRDVTLVDAATLFSIWWGSPSHRANLLYDWPPSSDPKMLLGYALRYDWGDQPGVWTAFYTQLFIAFGTPAGATLIQGELDLKYTLDTALITQLDTGYSLDAYTPVTNQHESTYGLRVAAQHESQYGCRVGAQHEAPQHYGISQQHSALWAGTTQVLTQHVSDYAIKSTDQVTSSHSSEYGIRVGAQHASPYAMNTQVVVQHEATYGDAISVTTQFESLYDLSLLNPVRSDHTSYWSMADNAVTVTTNYATFTVNGNTIDVEEAVISISEGDYAWNASVILTDLTQYQNINRGDAAVLNIQGETYDLLVESKSLSRGSPASISMRIEAMSPSIKHRMPYSLPTSYENLTPVDAKTAVEAILGETVTWRTTNWSLPALRISTENAEPIDIAQSIVSSVGAVIEPNKDGSLYVRDTFVVNIPDYDTAIPDQVYTDVQDNLSVEESFESRTGYNKFRIAEGAAGYTDTLEWVPDEDPLKGGILRAYPTPWRTSINVVHTDGASVALSPLGVRTRTETEIVEFRAGVGSLSYPAVSIDSVTWHSSTLPGLALDPHTATITAGTTVNQGYGVAEISYTVESIDYSTNAPIGSVVQYLIEDL